MHRNAEQSGGTASYCHKAIWCRATDLPRIVAIQLSKASYSFTFFKLRISAGIWQPECLSFCDEEKCEVLTEDCIGLQRQE
jgi:hypothetical protein